MVHANAVCQPPPDLNEDEKRIWEEEQERYARLFPKDDAT